MNLAIDLVGRVVYMLYGVAFWTLLFGWVALMASKDDDYPDL